jgi:hypothetical protein
VRRAFADHVPFELAACLRIGAEQHPGLEVSPSIERIQTEPEGTSLRALLGSVVELDRVGTAEDLVERRVAQGLPEDWLDDLVPAGTTGSAEERERLQEDAKQLYERELLRRERSGTTGLEAAFDDALTGRSGCASSSRTVSLASSCCGATCASSPARTCDSRSTGQQHVAEDACALAWRKESDRFHEQRDRTGPRRSRCSTRLGRRARVCRAPIVSVWARDVPGVV